MAIAGGGLAGLSLAIQLAGAGHSVVVFEKERYPFHRVCGEYISLESWDFLNSLGVDLAALQVPIIRKLELSAGSGKFLQQNLPLGGFGISRYLLDHTLAGLARSSGVTLLETTRVNELYYNGKEYTIQANGQTYTSRLAAGCFGKRSNLDVKWKRPFVLAVKNKLNNYIGVKYHIRTHFPDDLIALHAFPGGYAGLVKVEGEKYNLCYLATAARLQECGNHIESLEEKVLASNPRLREILQNQEKCDPSPVTISQISFDKKSQAEQEVLLLGDAAGMITPLCGNGMSMALHAARLAFPLMDLYLQGRMNNEKLIEEYTRAWQKEFSRRLRTGRQVQRLSLNPFLMNGFIRSAKLFPGLLRQLIRHTHGEAF